MCQQLAMFPAISDFPECQLQGDHQMLSFRLTISTAQRKDLGRKLKSAQQLGDHTTAGTEHDREAAEIVGAGPMTVGPI